MKDLYGRVINPGTGLSVHTFTLEMQGVPADVARHRRSMEAGDACDGKTSVDRYDAERGVRRQTPVRCLNAAVALTSDDVNLCERHR